MKSFFIFLILLFSIVGNTQNFFYHLMPKQPTVNFTLASQGASEANGIFAPDWHVIVAAWDKRRKIEITPVTTALTNFPLLVKLDSTKINYANLQAAAQDLRFVDSGGALLSYEIETWNSSGESTVWVKVPSIAASPTVTNIWMYYGNGAASDAQTPTTVWDANHLGVWHFKTNGNDSTTNANNATVTGASNTTSNIGNGYSFAGGGNNIKPPNGMISNTTTGTFELLFKTSGTNVPLLGWSSSAYPTASGSMVPTAYIGIDGKIRAEQWVGSLNQITSSGTYNDNKWHHMAFALGGGSHSLYVDGALIGTVTATITTFANTNNYIGMADMAARPSTSGTWTAANSTVIDEVKFSNNKRSADWILQEYNAVQDNVNIIYREESNSSSLVNATLQLSNSYPQNVTVPFTVTGTSTSGTDHNLSSGSSIITAGNTTQNIPIRIYSDNLTEGNESIIVSIGTPTNGRQGTDIPVHTVTIIDDVNVAPVANDETINLTNFSAVQINVLANDTDANGDALWIQSFTNPATGTLTKSGRTLTYTPTTDFPATDSFTYTVTDKRGGTAVGTVTLNYQIPFTWTGAGGDANWNTAANWLGGVVPGAGNMAYFNNSCSTNCNPTMNVAINILGLQMNSSYTGTITQAAGISVTTATGGWIQRAGTFTGSDANITLGGSFLMAGGTYQSTSAILRINAGNFSVLASSVFQHNSGTLYLGCTHSLTCVVNTNSSAYNNVTFAGYYSWFSLAGTTMNVSGLLSMGDTYGGSYNSQPIDNGQINASGNVSVINTGYRGNAVINIVGNASGQTITGLAGMYMPGLNIAAGSNDVTLSGPVSVSYVYNLTSVGTFTVTGSTLNIFCGYGMTCNINPGTVNYNHFSVIGNYTTYNFGGATVNVNGDLNVGDVFSSSYTSQPLNNGTFLVQGNVTISNQGYKGTALINAVGSGPKNISYTTSAGFPGSTFTINKSTTADVMTLSNALSLPVASQALSVTSGTLNLAGFALTVPGALTVGAAGKVICNGGTITAGSTSIIGEISCGSSIGITWTGNAGDNLWSTAGNWTNNNIPGASDVAIFNGNCAGANCNVQINSNLSVRGILMTAAYTGTITQNSTRTLTVGTAGFQQNAGTFSGGDSAMTITNYLKIAGGTFTATSATLTLGSINSCNTARNLDYTAGTFNHNSGYFKVIQSRGAAASCNSTSELNFIAGFTLYDFEVNAAANGAGWYAFTNYTNSNKIIVDRNFYNYGPIFNINVDLSGDIYINKSNINIGSGLITLIGNASQNYNFAGSIPSESIRINKTGGSVQAAGGTTTLQTYGLTLSQGTFTAPSGTLGLGASVSASASFSVLVIASGTTFNTNSGTIAFNLQRYSSACSCTTTANINVYAGFEFNNVEINSPAPSGGWYDYVTSATSPLIVNGNFDLKGKINNANWNVKGNISVTNNAYGGSGLVKAIGTTNQTITGGSTAALFPPLEIASTGGTVYLAGTLAIYNNYTYTSGVVDAGTSTMYFAPVASGSASYVVGAVAYNHVTFAGNSTSHNLNSGTMTVLGNLTLSDINGSPGSINSGTINLSGNLVASNIGKIGSVVIRLVGSTNQSITGVAAGWIPTLEIASTGGTVSLLSSLLFKSSYTVTGGTVDPGTSTLIFTGTPSTTHTHTFGSWNYNAVTFGGNFTSHSLNSGTLNVLGTLTFTDINGTAGNVNSGTINAGGNIVFSSSGKNGNAVLNLNGAVSSTLTTATTSKLLATSHVVAKTGGAQVSLVGDANYTTAGMDFTINSGTLNMAGYDFNVNDVLTVGAAGTVSCNGGDLTFGTLTNSGVISCPGYGSYPFNWTGAAADGNWNTASNWQGGVLPTSTDVVVFDNAYCGANCDVALNAAVNVKGFDIKSGYTGTITQNVGITITVGSKGWKQAAGIFVGSNASITITGVLTVNGGTYTATSGTTTFSNNVTLGAGITFNHNNGTFTYIGSVNRTLALGGKRFYDFNLNPVGGNQTFSSTLFVDRNFSVPDDIMGTSGTIEVKGNVSLGVWGFDSSAANVNLRLTGSGNQTISSTTGYLPNIEFASTGGTIFMSGTYVILGNIVYTSGTVDLTGSNINMLPVTGVRSINAAAVDFNNVTFSSSFGSFVITGGMNVKGNLNFADDTLGVTGTINAYGNITLSSWAFDSSGTNALLVAAGTSDATFTVVGGTAIVPKLKISKTGGASLNLASAVSIASPKDLVVDAGANVNMNGFNLTTTGATTNNGTIHRGPGTCGTFSAGTLTGNAVVCP